MRRAVLELGAPAAGESARHGQLGEAADQRLGVVAQRERAQIALGLVRLLAGKPPRERDDQGDRPEGDEEPGRQPIEGQGGAQGGDSDEPIGNGRGDEVTPAPLVLEVRELVREDRGLLAGAEQLERGIGEEHARDARRWKREGIDDSAPRHRHAEQVRTPGAGGLAERLPAELLTVGHAPMAQHARLFDGPQRAVGSEGERGQFAVRVQLGLAEHVQLGGQARWRQRRIHKSGPLATDEQPASKLYTIFAPPRKSLPKTLAKPPARTICSSSQPAHWERPIGAVLLAQSARPAAVCV